ncbi:RNA polymerase subunit sigma-70 [Pseudonocardia sp. CA-107938]|uniref:RNA polymerase subunit sigma-70 n=1 Tax=Pseudonocardia sp. CA-107938 TaxID=3240021 RepID=UPI003D934D46
MGRDVLGSVDDGEFAPAAEPYRREILAHCYRMLGSWDEAEDAVQETYLRAWRSYRGLREKDLLRAWLFRIATNVCLTAGRRRSRRPLPSGLAGAAEDGETPWVQPIADAAMTDGPQDPAVVVAARESVRLALIASLQLLAPRQRAVLILRDVLAFPAADVAAMLGTTVVAVKSALQRARARLAEVAPTGEAELLDPDDPRARELLEQYVAGFEHADTAALEKALRTDAALELIPSGEWFAGRLACLGVLRASVGAPGTWRMVPTTANGQPAAIAYLRGPDGVHRPFGIGILWPTASGIARILAIEDPGLAARFGLPSTLDRPGAWHSPTIVERLGQWSPERLESTNRRRSSKEAAMQFTPPYPLKKPKRRK